MKVLLIGAVCIAIFGTIGGFVKGGAGAAGESAAAGIAIVALIGGIAIIVAALKFIYRSLK